MKYLLKRGASPDCIRSSDGATPLHLVAQVRDPDANVHEAIRLLMEHGANVNAVNKTKLTPLHQAGGGAPWCLRNVCYLVAAGANPAYIDADATPQGKRPSSQLSQVGGVTSSIST